MSPGIDTGRELFARIGGFGLIVVRKATARAPAALCDMKTADRASRTSETGTDQLLGAGRNMAAAGVEGPAGGDMDRPSPDRRAASSRGDWDGGVRIRNPRILTNGGWQDEGWGWRSRTPDKCSDLRVVALPFGPGPPHRAARDSLFVHVGGFRSHAWVKPNGGRGGFFLTFFVLFFLFFFFSLAFVFGFFALS